MNDEPLPRPGTNIAIERRVERLELQVAALQTDVSLVKLEQTHARELISLNFGSLHRGQDDLGKKIDLIGTSLLKAQEEGARAAADPTVTPAGRAVMEKIQESWKVHADLDIKATDALNTGRRIESRVNRALGALAVVVFLITLVAPLVWHLIETVLRF